MADLVYGRIVAPGLLARLKDQGFTVGGEAINWAGLPETEQGQYLLDGGDGFTGFVVRDHDTIVGASEHTGIAYDAAGFSSLREALDRIRCLQSAELKRADLWNAVDAEAHMLVDDLWYIELYVAAMVPQAQVPSAIASTIAALEPFALKGRSDDTGIGAIKFNGRIDL